jgi:hypothetical protein
MLDHTIVDGVGVAHPPLMIAGIQIRAARTMLGWSITYLATHARIGTATVQRAESADIPPVTTANLFAIQRAIEAAGVIFIAEGQQSLLGGVGVRFRNSKNAGP